ncbi:hypothetical protein C8J56DRAFT_82675 [Mycena floridula]|nr:hypothetical protein C8J56DRAFT_82675 [Mycena floridula]
MLEAHNLHSWTLDLSDVDESGKLVITHFIPGPRDDPLFDPRIWMAFETNTLIKEDLLAYYKFLFDMIDWYNYPPIFTLLSPFHKAAPFQLSHPEINLPVYSLPGWNQVVNGIDTTVQETETGIVLTLLPDMTIRCCIPTLQIPTFSISKYMEPLEQIDMMLFATWACQANHLIHDLPINIMDLQTELQGMDRWIECTAKPINGWQKETESPLADKLLEREMLYLFCPQNNVGDLYWSEDEAGQNIIEDSLIQAAFGIIVHLNWYPFVYGIPSQFYEILCKIYESCGVDPYSTEVAEYLGLPVAVIKDGHPGLEEYMEGPEYTSDSESGDSDYVSASEDA